MNNQLALIDSFEKFQGIAKVFAASGMFSDVKGEAQVMVKIMAGAELGLPPFTSMQAFHIIQGKPTMSAQSIAARIKTSGRYNYRVTDRSATVCEVAFYETLSGKTERVHVERWDIARANKAGVKNLDKYPEAMLFSRAITSGARVVCPEVIGAFYASEELGAIVDDAGQVIDVTPAPQPEPDRPMTVSEAIPPAPKPDAWKDEITALALNAKAQADANHDPIVATRCRTAVDAARALFKKNGSATMEEIDEVRAALTNAIAQASQA